MCNCTGGIVSTGTDSGKRKPKNKGKKPKKLKCSVTSKQLRELDVKIISLRKLDKKDEQLKDSSSQVRTWIKDLKYECPNKTELKVIKEFIENEYNNISA